MNVELKISIITPSFNSEKTIERTIKSVLEQNYKNYEYIIIDGGSTDSTVDIIKKYTDLFEGRMKYVSEKDKGIYDAMNKGIKMAEGDLIGIINSDDYYETDCLKNVAQEYDAGRLYQILYGELRFINKAEEELEISLVHHRNMKERMIFHPSSFVSRSIYMDKFLYNTDYKYSSDLEFMLKAFQEPEIVFKPIYKVLSNFRMGGISFSNKALHETNVVKYKYGCITKKKYLFEELKLLVKRFANYG